VTRSQSVSPLITKEARALLPVWAATLFALAAAFAWRHRSYSDIGLVGYVAGVIVLGAHAIGHEYGHRTLPILLAQPASRARLFAAKFLVAGGMLATLAVAASVVFTTDRFRGNDAASTVMLPILGGVFLAPLFTMICRGTLAGAVLGGSSPMMLWVIAVLVAWWGFGVGGDALTAWVLGRWMILALIACPILGALTWRAFARMEALEGAPGALTLPRWRARAGARHRAPWRALVAKEIHLQQMTIAITLFYGVIWIIGAALRRSAPSSVTLPLEAVLLLYCLGLTIVLGALASAEERQQGTLDVQLLQPVSALWQWAVKCAVTLGLAVLLGVVVPAVLLGSFAEAGDAASSGRAASLVSLVVLVTSSSIYLSSLTSSGVRAMAWALPASIGAAIFIQTAQSMIASVSTSLGRPIPANNTEATVVAARVVPLLVVPALLWFGFVNHTSAEHPLRRTVTQVALVAMLTVAGIMTAGALI